MSYDDSYRICTATCPCQSRTPSEATTNAARMIGLDRDKASALLGLLQMNGWKLVRSERTTS